MSSKPKTTPKTTEEKRKNLLALIYQRKNHMLIGIPYSIDFRESEVQNLVALYQRLYENEFSDEEKHDFSEVLKVNKSYGEWARARRASVGLDY